MGLSTQQDQHFLFSLFEVHNLFQRSLLSVQHLSLHCQLLHLSSDNVFSLKQGASREREVLVSRSIVRCCSSHCPLPSTSTLPTVNRQMARGMDILMTELKRCLNPELPSMNTADLHEFTNIFISLWHLLAAFILLKILNSSAQKLPGYLSYDRAG